MEQKTNGIALAKRCVTFYFYELLKQIVLESWAVHLL